MKSEKKKYPALIVKKKWLDLILSGTKTWEIRRGRCTKNLGRIYFVESGTGNVVGYANFKDNIGPLSVAEFNHGTKRSCVDKVTSKTKLPYGDKTFAWVMEGARRLRSPIRIKIKPGTVIWTSVLI